LPDEMNHDKKDLIITKVFSFKVEKQAREGLFFFDIYHRSSHLIQ